MNSEDVTGVLSRCRKSLSEFFLTTSVPIALGFDIGLPSSRQAIGIRVSTDATAIIDMEVITPRSLIDGITCVN